MANAKEIQNRIKSIQDTMKITNAMYMMSSMKLRKAKAKLEHTETYFYELQKEIRDILLHFPSMRHLYFDNRGQDSGEMVKRKAFLVITGDKGMAGAYNHNVLKQAQKMIEASKNYRLFVVGEVGSRYFAQCACNVEENFHFSAQNPSIHRARVIAETMLDLYKREEIDEIQVIYTRMINGMTEEVETKQLLPLMTHDFIKQELLKEAYQEQGNQDEEALNEADDWFLIYPSPRTVLEKLAYNYVTGFLYGALVESSASEENARMMAMQSATNNAKAMLAELSVEYNRVRQAAITQEITEVIGGAKALKKKKKKQAR